MPQNKVSKYRVSTGRIAIVPMAAGHYVLKGADVI